MATPREIAEKAVEAIFDRSEVDGRVIHKDAAIDEVEKVLAAAIGVPLSANVIAAYDPATKPDRSMWSNWESGSGYIVRVDGGHWSDCAVHNGPALPAGECDCGGVPPTALTAGTN